MGPQACGAPLRERYSSRFCFRPYEDVLVENLFGLGSRQIEAAWPPPQNPGTPLPSPYLAKNPSAVFAMPSGGTPSPAHRAKPGARLMPVAAPMTTCGLNACWQVPERVRNAAEPLSIPDGRISLSNACKFIHVA
jgi:hypothetical protein